MATTSPYDIGDLVELEADFSSDPDGTTPADPTTVTLRVRKPDGTVVVVNHDDLTNPSVGKWTHNISPDQPGIWWYRFEGTGAVTAAEEKAFRVRVRRVPAA